MSAPSSRRTRTDAISAGSKFPRFTPCRVPGVGGNGSQCVTQHRVLGMAFDFDGTELEVDPRPTDSPAQRAVAARRDGWHRWEAQAHSAAVAGALVHGEWKYGARASILNPQEAGGKRCSSTLESRPAERRPEGCGDTYFFKTRTRPANAVLSPQRGGSPARAIIRSAGSTSCCRETRTLPVPHVPAVPGWTTSVFLVHC